MEPTYPVFGEEPRPFPRFSQTASPLTIALQLFDALAALHDLTPGDAVLLALAAESDPDSLDPRASAFDPTVLSIAFDGPQENDGVVVEVVLQCVADRLDEVEDGSWRRLTAEELHRALWLAALLRLSRDLAESVVSRVESVYATWDESDVRIEVLCSRSQALLRHLADFRVSALEAVTERRVSVDFAYPGAA